MDLVDCPDGLARCVDGQLQKSKLAAIAPPAVCPWVPAGECPGECVEGVVIDQEHAAQLCRVEAGPWKSQRLPQQDECHDARWECAASRVIDCQAKSIVAVCTKGCALGALEDEVPEGDAVNIMCLR